MAVKRHPASCSNTPSETMEEYSAEYNKRYATRGANFVRAVQLNRLNNRLVQLNVDLELARNEASHEIVAALDIETQKMKAEKIALEAQTEEQRAAAYAQKQAERANNAMLSGNVDKWSAMQNEMRC